MAEEGTNDTKQPVTMTWESDPNQVIVFDATLREGHASRSELTSFPIESGSDHTDHIRRMRDELSLVIVVSDSPIIKPNDVLTPANTGGDANQRAVSAYNFLLQSKDQAKLLQVFTTLRGYRNMAIESIDTDRDVNTSKMLRANIELKEILIAVTEQVDAPVPANPVKRRRAGLGKQNLQKASEANKTKGRKTSVALKIGQSGKIEEAGAAIAGAFGF